WVPLWANARGLAYDLEVAPAVRQSLGALGRGRAPGAKDEVHRLASAIRRMAAGQPTAGPLLECGRLAGGERLPDIGEHGGAVGAATLEYRLRPGDPVLD